VYQILENKVFNFIVSFSNLSKLRNIVNYQ
jgi:hypothetical protein